MTIRPEWIVSDTLFLLDILSAKLYFHLRVIFCRCNRVIAPIFLKIHRILTLQIYVHETLG